MIVGVLKARLRDNDGERINVQLKCNLDREDCASLRSPFTLPYHWISGWDFCLVGVSCHIPSSGLTYACFHLCIMFKFLKLELRNFGSLKNLNKEGQRTLENAFNVFKMALNNVGYILARVLHQTKNNEHFWGIFWALNLNHYFICIWNYIHNLYRIYFQIPWNIFMCFWKSPLSSINIFRGVFGIVWIIFKFKTVAKQIK